jgi:FkbM family methyltransferase
MKYFLFRILRKMGVLSLINLKPAVNISGKKFILPKVGPDQIQMVRLGQHEPYLLSLLQLLLPDREGVFIDVGVNRGQTLLKVKAIRKDQSYLGFEPNPACNAYTSELIRLNRLAHCTLMPLGLAEHTDIVTLFADNATGSMGSTISGFRPDSFYNIAQHVIDFNGHQILRKQNNKIVSIFIFDVVGGEPEVIYGLRQSLIDSKPVIPMEILPVIEPKPENDSKELRHFRQQRQEKMISFLQDIGYVMFRHLHTGELIQLDTIEPHSDLFLCEYVFIHSDDTQAWEKLETRIKKK